MCAEREIRGLERSSRELGCVPLLLLPLRSFGDIRLLLERSYKMHAEILSGEVLIHHFIKHVKVQFFKKQVRPAEDMLLRISSEITRQALSVLILTNLTAESEIQIFHHRDLLPDPQTLLTCALPKNCIDVPEYNREYFLVMRHAILGKFDANLEKTEVL